MVAVVGWPGTTALEAPEDGATPAPFASGIRDRMAEANNHTVTAVNAKRRPWRAQ
jgi:hypothetical protein